MRVTAADTSAQRHRRRAASDAIVASRKAFVGSKLGDVAKLLRVRFGASRVWLFGSHAVGSLHPDSDVDFAVEGISPSLIDRAHSEVEAIVEGPVDLLDIETASASLRARIDRGCADRRQKCTLAGWARPTTVPPPCSRRSR